MIKQEKCFEPGQMAPDRSCPFNRKKPVRVRANLWIPVVLAAVSGLFPLWGDPNPKGEIPSVEYMQARLWNNMKLADFNLNGTVESAHKTYPITLKTKGHEMIYDFAPEPLQIRVFLSPDETQVQRRDKSSAPWVDVSPAKRMDKILDTDITYEDLCLDFIRWEDVRPIGTDSIKTLPAWAYEAKPSGPSRFAKARYWISSEYGAFLRVDGYNDKNEVVKRVEVNGVQKIGKAYVLKEMLVSTLLPGRDISSSRTWVKISGGTAGSEDATPAK